MDAPPYPDCTHLVIYGTTLIGDYRTRAWVTHPWLARYTSWDHDYVCAGESLLETVIGREVAHDFCGRGDVREIGSDSGGVDDIVERKLRAELSYACSSLPMDTDLLHERVGLEEKGERLADPT